MLDKEKTLTRAKASLRLRNTSFDKDLLKPLIEAALLDLKISGANLDDSLYSLVERAVIHYIHINFPMGANEKEVERHERSYQSLKNQLALTVGIQ